MDESSSYNLPWDKNLETGVVWIDEQHKQLLDQLVKMTSAIAQKKCEQNVRSTISFLNDYIRSHFNNEQSYMQRFNYPQTTAHLEEHRRFAEKFKENEKKYILQGASRQLAGEIARDMWDWYKNHICKFDKKLAVFLKVRKSQQDKKQDTIDNKKKADEDDE